MDRFVARQPIFDRDGGVQGYELLFRSGPQNYFPQVDLSYASTRVVHDALHVFGLDLLARSHPVWINVTRDVLLDGTIRLLPAERTCVEVLESVVPDADVLEACASLRRDGYTIALDDFVLLPEYEPLVALADVIKVDFLHASAEQRRTIALRFGETRVRLLAEKIETTAQLVEAKALGYALFQGYFFQRPEILSSRDVPAFKMNYLRLLDAVSGPRMDFARIEAHVKADPALSLKLLRYIGSAAFGVRRTVTSLQQALVLLGEDAMRKWIALMSLNALGGDRPTELMVSALVRASFCERLAPHLRMPGAALDLFLLGMLSLADVFLGRPLVEVLEAIAVPEAVRAALTRGEGRLGRLVGLVAAYERGVWEDAMTGARALDLDDGVVADAHRESIAWACAVLA